MKRRSLFSASAAVVAGLGGAWAGARASSAGASLLTVGAGGDHATLESALLEAEGLASASHRLVIKLLPGVHLVSGGEVAVPQWVTLEGSGRKAATLALFGDTTHISVFSNSALRKLSLTAHRTGPGAAPGMLVAPSP